MGENEAGVGTVINPPGHGPKDTAAAPPAMQGQIMPVHAYPLMQTSVFTPTGQKCQHTQTLIYMTRCMYTCQSQPPGWHTPVTNSHTLPEMHICTQTLLECTWACTNSTGHTCMWTQIPRLLVHVCVCPTLQAQHLQQPPLINPLDASTLQEDRVMPKSLTFLWASICLGEGVWKKSTSTLLSFMVLNFICHHRGLHCFSFLS